MRAAIVGLGAIAPIHYRAISRVGGEVTFLCERDAEKVKAFREETGCAAPAVPEFSSLLAAGGFDVLHICTPHYLHADMVVEGLAAGYHVLCEKPLCIKKEDFSRILAAEAQSKGLLGVCHQNRYNAANQETKKLIEADPAIAGFGHVAWKRDAAYYASGAWRGKWASEGGGVMINQALHTLDLLLWMMGEPDEVCATAENRHLSGVIEVEDTVSARFTYKDGRVFNFYATTAAGADFPVQIELATAGGHTIVSGNDHIVLDGAIRPASDGGVHYGKEVWGDGHKKLIADFYACIEEERPFSISGKEGLSCVRAILGLYRSNGKTITL